ncbi:hypothetical protein AMTRI_Chr01g111490 [Amborella trichopoda]|uniref:DEK-C domain-containing protein n=1 Tax=Amborella trichopoda TaxID=13333 RepID=W1Q0S0_AMBTC|nr:RNA polymerase II transcriptional coactivator KELP [Amborella trichopoda]ERN14086.1 hypothetical protein AMTR_s00021p00230560 [Amborella trichopoda]|eukprot:XP_006852619.1 RNA polymerase II transcriptional coactivator KELP [Amborella trichopoda]
MDLETQKKIEETVAEVLRDADMAEITEFKVRKLAGEKLGMDLSGNPYKKVVKNVVLSFIASKREAQQEEDERDSKTESCASNREFDANGDPIICRLSNKRKVTIQDFRGKTLVSIREYYEKDGKELPSSKGISLSTEQWEAFRNAVPAIEEAIEKLQSRLN